jgi:hypothetical protein
MAMKWHDVVGFVGVTVETDPGVYENQMIERYYYGDVIRDTRSLTGDDKVNNDISVANSFRIVADAYAGEHIFAMRYLRWQGVLWAVESVEVQHPRLLVRLGGKYDGPTA